MTDLNGPVIFVKRVDTDTIAFHRKLGNEGVYAFYRISEERRRPGDVIGFGFSLSEDEVRLLQADRGSER